jgi:DNA-binding CsgD family transcriptional regulator
MTLCLHRGGVNGTDVADFDGSSTSRTNFRAKRKQIVKSYLMSTQTAEATSPTPQQQPASPPSFRLERERPKPNLTEREKEVLRLVCDGLTNAEIAACLHVSRETVKSELKRIFRKIGVGNRTQAAVLLVKNNWL